MGTRKYAELVSNSWHKSRGQINIFNKNHFTIFYRKSLMGKIRHAISVVFIASAISIFLLPAASSFAEEITDPIAEILKEVKKIVQEVEHGQIITADQDLQNLILTHWPDLLKAALLIPPESWVTGEGDQTCSGYKDDLEEMFYRLGLTLTDLGAVAGAEISTLHFDPFTLILDRTPCVVLYPSYILLEEGPVKIDKLTDELVKLEVHLKKAAEFLLHTKPCDYYKIAHLEIDIAKDVILATGAVFRLIGLIGDAAGKTIISGPIKVEAGVMGFLDGGLTHNNVAMFGKIMGGIGTAITAVGHSIGDFCSNCELISYFENVQQQVKTHDEEIKAQVNTHDEEIKAQLNTHGGEIKAQVNAHDEDIKALLEDNRVRQLEIIKLLMTPQGLRESEYCSMVDCHVYQLWPTW